MKLKGLAAATSILALTLTLGACGGSDSDKSTLQKAIDDGKITVGFAGEAPYSFEEGGELQGASVSLAKAVFKELGVDDVEGVNTEFGSLIPGLNADRFDAISAGMSILPDRCEQAAFGDPEFMYTTALMTKEGKLDGMKNLDDVKDKGVKLATMTGAIESDYAKDLGIETQQVGTPQDGMDAVTTGRADVFALTAISLNWMAKNNADAGVEVSESFVQEIDGVPQVGAGATVFRTDDEELRDEWNKGLDKIISDEDAYLDAVGDYGFTAEERPDGSITTDQLCKGELPTADS
ncbi:MAG: ectoine/hydroxyectoine ABC transporter substrate-binding protein EhuB [Brevibacterium sp.]|uniref:Polar amino acid transport system substrate-binding protein n=2 Tax=Brevibacterium linens TaxID=1703 RepID=A0A2H1J4N7_BRELN|nr:ectoine/hydroxyectoine ABC transporter substrate-binding protein EhuB [Brevibacterium linens]AZU01290.1 ectoine/hydroxyectoine ABC transporter substrate-binding protein EhuB [Brevibacterium linens]KAB1949914.1 ectoine/hydroxyectoine ABC transporter substrate-binding protein EhuB [Brevibacterium linens ATCC 9172]SMX66760.1 polar amino acid transport system substrate-binding protein [Brevibacterium linens ATCC 9172]SMX82182.1 polar amino acid transport system substrate-binding protein [Breviba